MGPLYCRQVCELRLFLSFTIMRGKQLIISRGVDNGAAGAATAAPIIWLVVVIQK